MTFPFCPQHTPQASRSAKNAGATQKPTDTLGAYPTTRICRQIFAACFTKPGRRCAVGDTEAKPCENCAAGQNAPVDEERLHSRFRPRNAAPQNEVADFFTEFVATDTKNTAASNSMIHLK
jgi:hypothetical protein